MARERFARARLASLASAGCLAIALLFQGSVALAADDPAEKPTGTPAELVERLETLMSARPQVRSREEFVEYMLKTYNEVAAIADAILASADATEQELVTAAEAKLNALDILSRLGDATAAPRLGEYVKQLLAGDNPRLVDAARSHQLMGRLRDLDRENREAVLKLVDDVKQQAAVRPDRQMVAIAYATAGAAEELGLTDVAAKALHSFAESFRNSDDRDVADYAEKFAGMARRLNLMGNPIAIAGKQLDGEQYDIANHKGKVVLVDFWATWCGPCLAELPNLLSNYEKYHDKGFEVVGISLDDDRQALEGFLKNNPLPWPILFSDDDQASGWNHPLATAYGISAIPTVILVDKEGKVIHLNARGHELGAALEKLLGAAESPAKDKDSAEPNTNKDDASTDKP